MTGVEYISEDLSDHPTCPHGPSLLFSQKDDEQKKFYACSAYRSKQFCSFHLWEDEKVTVDKEKMWQKEKQKLIPNINHRNLFITLNNVQQEVESERVYCFDCSALVPKKFKSKHTEHNTKIGITNTELTNPSKWLKPLDHPKKEAQYLFSDTAVNAVTKILENLKIKNVICIGAPRIHENIQNNRPDMSSLMLDIDHRYHSFFGPLQFCWYNLFNNYFFLDASKQVFTDFLQSENGEGFAILMDPPFGGRVEPIAQTLASITEQFQDLTGKTNLPVFLFFPYFMEPLILNSLPEYKMSDYQVDYDNHSLFNRGPKGRKYGSPVRFFTNIKLSEINLSDEENYHFCSKCDYWVSDDNKHCNKCKSCTSKDGRTYTHCDSCDRCVKPTWKHCKKCDRCALSDHNCDMLPFAQVCFHCKERGHKKRDCPQVNHEELKRKRDTKAEKAKKKKLKK